MSSLLNFFSIFFSKSVDLFEANHSFFHDHPLKVKSKGNQLVLSAEQAYVSESCDVDGFSLSYLIQFLFSPPLWPTGGVLHFHPDNVCEDRDKVSMKHELWLLLLF